MIAKNFTQPVHASVHTFFVSESCPTSLSQNIAYFHRKLKNLKFPACRSRNSGPWSLVTARELPAMSVYFLSSGLIPENQNYFMYQRTKPSFLDPRHRLFLTPEFYEKVPMFSQFAQYFFVGVALHFNCFQYFCMSSSHSNAILLFVPRSLICLSCPPHQFRCTYTPLISRTKRNGTFWPPAKLQKVRSRKSGHLVAWGGLIHSKQTLFKKKQYKNIFEHRFRFIQAFLAYFELCFEPLPVQPFFRFVFLRDVFRA